MCLIMKRTVRKNAPCIAILLIITLFVGVSSGEEFHYRTELIEYNQRIRNEVLEIATSFGGSEAAISAYVDVFDSVWGKLVNTEGGVVWHTITASQAKLINYPAIGNVVYRTPKGKRYHSVDWCYSLQRSKDVFPVLLSDTEKKLSPCSKCINPYD